MFFKKLLLQFNDFLKRNSVMKFWLLSYIAVLIVILLLVGCAENIFIGFVVDDTILLKTEEMHTFSDKMEMLTEECKLFAAKLAVDDSFKETYMNGINSSEEHYNIRKAAADIRRTMTLVDEFFVYLKSDNLIINSIGHVCTPQEFYDVYYSKSNINYEKWIDEILKTRYSGYHVFETVSANGLGTVTKFCYALPTKLLNGTESTIFTVIDSTRYSKELDELNMDENVSVLLYDESNKRYFEKGTCIPSDSQLEKMETAGGFYETEIDGEKVVMNYVRSSIASWKYAFVMPYAVFWEKLITVRYISVAIMVLLAFLGISGIYLITKYNYKTVADIIKKIEMNFSGSTGDSKNEYVRINQIIDVAARLNDRVEEQEKQVHMDVVLKLLLGLTDNEMKADSSNYDEMFKSNYFVTSVFCTATYEKLFEHEEMSSGERFSTAKLIITNIFTELMEPYGSVDAVEIDNIVFLFSPEEKYISSALEIVRQKAQETVEAIQKYFELNITCGLSGVHEGISNICTTYTEALSALNLSTRSQKLAVNTFTDANNQNNCYYYSVEQAQHLIQLLNQADKASALRQIDMILEMNRDILQFANLRKALVTDIAGTIMKAALNIGYRMDAEKLMDYVNIGDYAAINKVFETYVNDICDFVDKGSLGYMDTIIDRINVIIAENYTNADFNVNMIADMLKINASYLSAIYKRKTNMNILDNIRAQRVKEAKRLILETDLSLETIARSAGFGSVTTFNRTFNKFTGVSPGVYRDMNSKH